MGTISGEEPMQWDSQSSGAHEEKILVSVRLRPLSEKEIAKNDASDWECVNNTTIIYKNASPERSMFPPAYSFDRVFGCDAATKEVYMEGAKQVALSVLDGINSSIFAYGQTSSGKTYTMTGITEYAMADIYDYIQKRKNREFVLKFSAMEIYNEAVRDLLSSDSTPLRLLDDPERGTIVEKLTEETLRDHNHLIELLSVCEAQRQSGETSLNETSSRSHQILRLTIESSGREFLSVDSSSTLSATVNFVDLAGSERASQTLSAGARLKEGCHINRSLLTLGTVIRKLSKGRNGHIPFRDSKLTRILQSSLGGNSRTAIICTMSPARSHVEQSRNTLLFASCAKEVATKAQVNVLMSDKTLVKHLQRELARLETELRSSSSPSAIGDSASLLKERELQIDKMTKEIKELTRQRDLALSRAEDLLQTIGTNPIPGLWVEPQALEAWRDEYSVSESPEVIDFSCVGEYPTPIKISHDSNKDFLVATEKSKDNFLFDGSSPQLSLRTPKFFRAGPHKDWEISHRNDGHSEYHCKELLCVENEELRVNKSIENGASTPGPEEKEENLAPVVIACEDATDLDHSNHIYDALKQKIHDMQKMIDHLVSFHPNEHSPCSTELSCQSLKHSRSRSCNAILGVSSPTPWFQKAEQDSFKNLSVRSEGLRFDELKPIEGIRKLSRKNSEASLQSSEISVQTSELSLQSSEASVQTAAPNRHSDNSSKESREEAGTSSSRANVLAKPLLEKESFNDSEREPTTEESRKNEKEDSLENTQGALESHLNWPAEFRRQRREIIKLWDSCNVPLVHRTYFFLLFNGADQSDSVYIEVELRRLSFLKDSFYKGTEALNDGQTLTLASSARALRREREALSKRVMKKFSRKEMQSVYKTWGIGLRTKRRRLQLVYRLWTDTEDVEHAKASAAVVAKLVGFVLPSNNAPKEMFGLSFLPQLPISRRPYGRKPGMPGLL